MPAYDTIQTLLLQSYEILLLMRNEVLLSLHNFTIDSFRKDTMVNLHTMSWECWKTVFQLTQFMVVLPELLII